MMTTTVPAATPPGQRPLLLEGRAVAFTRRDEPVFGPVDFALHAGEVLVVEGDNGSGKTTLLRLLAGLLKRHQGVLELHGQALDKQHGHGEIILLGHQLGLKHDLSSLENLRATVGLFGCRHGISPVTALASTGLGGYEHEPVRRLSAGQKKRAALARLLLVPAAIWLLDEPCANLDGEGTALVNRLLEQHTHRGGAALVTSHGATDPFRGQPQRIRLSA